MLELVLLSIIFLCGIFLIGNMKSYNKYNQNIAFERMEELKVKERLEREERERKYMLEREERERKERLEREEREENLKLRMQTINFEQEMAKEEYLKNDRIDKASYDEACKKEYLDKQLTFNELIEAINFIIARVWSHEEHYYLKAKDIVTPKISEESVRFHDMVLVHMSPELRRQAMLYFSDIGLHYYLETIFNDLIWDYTMDRNDLQGIYKYIYGNNREKLKKDLAKIREEAKGEKLVVDDNKKSETINNSNQ